MMRGSRRCNTAAVGQFGDGAILGRFREIYGVARIRTDQQTADTMSNAGLERVDSLKQEDVRSEHLEPVARPFASDADNVAYERILAWSDKERRTQERKLVRCIDLQVMAPILLCYILNYLDRNSIAQGQSGVSASGHAEHFSPSVRLGKGNAHYRRSVCLGQRHLLCVVSTVNKALLTFRYFVCVLWNPPRFTDRPRHHLSDAGKYSDCQDSTFDLYRECDDRLPRSS